MCNLHMMADCGCTGVALIAVCAIERPLSGMNEPVRFKVFYREESLAAVRAGKGPLPAVSLHVVLQLEVPLESLAAIFAVQLFFAGEVLFVVAEVVPHSLATHRTKPLLHEVHIVDMCFHWSWCQIRELAVLAVDLTVHVVTEYVIQ